MKSPCELYWVTQAARDRLAAAAIMLRSLRGTDAERVLDWKPVSVNVCPTTAVLQAKVGSGILLLSPRNHNVGIGYTSSFGPNSEKSFSGYLPGLTLEEAKLLVYHDAAEHW